ncbi:MAG: ABC transporter ATP-binding protein [Myxococcota bacterium]
MEIESGEVFGFLGPNGAGKSTTVQMLCGLLSPCGGDILIYGRSLRAHPEMRTQIGICPQQLVIWDKMTPLEQLMFMASTYQIPAKRARALALLLLEQMGLWDKKDTLAKLLSGGMKRRLNLLMALMHEPSILVLDEPEAGLDPQSRILVREYIRSWAREGRRTVLLTSHNMDEVERLADRIGIMDRGALLVQGTSQQLKAKVGQEETCSIQVVDTSCSRVQRALQFLERLLLTPQVLSDRLCFSMQKPAQMLPQVLEVLQHCEVHIRGLQMHTPTLEDVFLALTGRRLREPS